MSLTELDAFFTDHRQCGDLTLASMAQLCGSRASAGRGWRGGWMRATLLRSTVDPSYRASMDRRRFLVTSLAGALAAPLAVEGAGGEQRASTRVPWWK